MQITYRQSLDASFEMYRCRLSGRQEFNLPDAAYRCRWLVRDGHAVEAIACDGDQIVSHWRRQGSEAVKLIGPDV
jgi:hypothetical protein